jgi:hypothetical protein
MLETIIPLCSTQNKRSHDPHVDSVKFCRFLEKMRKICHISEGLLHRFLRRDNLGIGVNSEKSKQYSPKTLSGQ